MINNNLVNYRKSIARVKCYNYENYKIYTPEIIQKYKSYLKIISKFTNDKTKTKFIMYNKVFSWYINEKNINLSMEKIHIHSKLDSYASGGCGITGSFFAGLIASILISYFDTYIKKLNLISCMTYLVLILSLGIKILSKEDIEVEMYNMFLEVLNTLDYDKNERLG